MDPGGPPRSLRSRGAAVADDLEGAIGAREDGDHRLHGSMRRGSALSGIEDERPRSARSGQGPAADGQDQGSLRAGAPRQEAPRRPSVHGEDRRRAAHPVHARRGARAAVFSLALVLHSRTSRAACQPGHLDNCSIDLFQGPVLAPARATGLGGAFAAYAEGVDAIASNAAAVAGRPPFGFSWFDYDLSLGISF